MNFQQSLSTRYIEHGDPCGRLAGLTTIDFSEQDACPVGAGVMVDAGWGNPVWGTGNRSTALGWSGANAAHSTTSPLLNNGPFPKKPIPVRSPAPPLHGPGGPLRVGEGRTLAVALVGSAALTLMFIGASLAGARLPIHQMTMDEPLVYYSNKKRAQRMCKVGGLST
jgi:hypothetical protein